MPAKYRVDCKLANHNGVHVRSEPWYMSDTMQLKAFKAKHLSMPHDDPRRMVFVINTFIEGKYKPVYRHKQWVTAG